MRTRIYTTPNLNALRAMAAKLLPTLNWRHHGIGVLQAYISQYTRLHIWHDRLHRPRMRDSGGIHDHRFRLESTILIGGLTNRECVLDRGVHPPTYDIYEVINASTGKTDPPTKTRDQVSVVFGDVELEEGDTYSYPKRAFHETIHHGVTITLVTKHEQEDAPARLLAPVGTTPVHAFHASIDRATIEDIVHEAENLLWRALGEVQPQRRAVVP